MGLFKYNGENFREVIEMGNYIFYYDGFAEFETVIPALFFNEKMSSIALEKRAITG